MGLTYILLTKHRINFNLYKYILLRSRDLICLRRSISPGRNREDLLNRHTPDLTIELIFSQYGFPPKLEDNHI